MTPDLQAAIEAHVAEREASFIPGDLAHVACLHRSALAILAGQEHGLKTRLHAGTAFWRVDATGYWGFRFDPHLLEADRPFPPFNAVPVHVWVSYPEHGVFFDPSTGTFPEGARREGFRWSYSFPPPRCWWPDGSQPSGAVYLPSMDAGRFAAHHLWNLLASGT